MDETDYEPLTADEHRAVEALLAPTRPHEPPLGDRQWARDYLLVRCFQLLKVLVEVILPEDQSCT